MAPLREFLCLDCGFIMEELIRSPEDNPSECCHCESNKLERLPSAPGGYQINGGNSSSTRPRGSGSFKRSK